MYARFWYPLFYHSQVLLFKNQFKETTFDSDGFWTEKKSEAKTKSKYIPEWGSKKAADPYVLEKYASPDMPIPGSTLWKIICDNYTRIPVVKINHTSTIGEIYGELIRHAIECATVEGYEFMNGKDRCYIPKEMFDEIAAENNYKATSLKNTFDTMGLFIKDKATKGYQYSKRLHGKVYRFYALRKNFSVELSGDCEIAECEKLGFETDVKTLAEQERERFDALAKRVRDTVAKEIVTKDELSRLLL